MQPVAIARPMKDRAYPQFRSCVLATDPAHDLASASRCDDVGHLTREARWGSSSSSEVLPKTSATTDAMNRARIGGTALPTWRYC